MENLRATQGKPEKRFSDMTLGEAFLPTFQPVEILRPLGSYGRMLDLQPGILRAPNPEFLVRLLTDHTSHQAFIRHYAGSQYKNLENLIRGKHKVSRTSKQMLASSLGFSLDDIEKLYNSAPSGLLMPKILDIFQIVEGLPARVMSGIFDREVPCPCCGGNLLDDVNVWWSKEAPGMGAAEYHFAERLLRALLGAGLIERLVAQFQEERANLSLDRLGILASPSRHPIGNWLSEAQEAMSCASLAELADTMQLQGNVGNTFSHGRLKKWSAGQDVMPLKSGEAIAEACGQPKSGMPRLIAARTIALVTDYVAATLPATTHITDRKIAQEIVCARIGQLESALRIALAAVTGKLPRRFLPQGR